jgi:nitroreductase
MHMNIFEVFKARRSVRAYRDTPVEQEKLDQILEAANQAPSAGNLQAYEIYKVTRPDLRAGLKRAASSQEFLEQAPIVLVFCANAGRSRGKYGARGMELYCIQDATIACTFAMLAAAGLGLSTVWVGAFDETETSRLLALPAGHRPVALLPVGYAAEQPRERGRRALSDLVHET